MRLAFIHNLPFWHPDAGGGQRVHHELAESALRRGHDVRSIFLGHPPAPTGTAPSYRVHWARPTGRLLGDVWSVLETSRKAFRSWRPHAVYASAAEGAGLTFVLPEGTGLLATSHHPDPPELERLRPLTRPLGTARRLRTRQRFWLERHLLRSAHGVVAVSEYGARALKERGYVDEDRPVTVVRNGVAERWFGPPDDLGSADAPAGDVLFVGRMDDQKGIDVLLRALARLDRTVTCALVGTGWKAEEYRGLARELGLGERVRFLGRRGPDEIRRLMADATVLAAPSRVENCPLVPLEAMAAGLPVVASGVGGTPEIVTDGESGLLVPADDPEALARGLARVLDDPALAAELVGGGRREAERHRWDDVVDRILRELALSSELATPQSPPGKVRSVLSAAYRRAGARSAAIRARARPSALPAEVRRIAVVRLGLLGDQLLTDPLLAALEGLHPEAALDLVVTEEGSVPPWIAARERVRVLGMNVRADGDGWRRPMEGAYRAALRGLRRAWVDRGPEVVLFADELASDPLRRIAADVVAQAPGDPWRAGLTPGGESLSFLHQSVDAGPPSRHEISRLLGLARSAGADDGFRLPRVPARGAGEPGLPAFEGITVVLHPGGSRITKRWPPSRFLELAGRLLADPGLRIVALGAADERALVEEAGLLVPHPRIVVRLGRSLEHVSNVVADAHLFIGSDSFPFHLAVAHGVPSIVLVGPGAARYHRYPVEHVHPVREPVVCSPRDGRECPIYTRCTHWACMKAIRIRDVESLAWSLLAHRRSAAGSPTVP